MVTKHGHELHDVRSTPCTYTLHFRSFQVLAKVKSSSAMSTDTVSPD